MRIPSLVALSCVLAFGLMGCAQTRSVYQAGKRQVASVSNRIRGCCPPAEAAPASCAQPCAPQTICYSEPVYSSCCGGDNGIGRGGTGAFRIP